MTVDGPRTTSNYREKAEPSKRHETKQITVKIYSFFSHSLTHSLAQFIRLDSQYFHPLGAHLSSATSFKNHNMDE